ncbi:MAG: ester cyclase [Chloroflexota bacterium]
MNRWTGRGTHQGNFMGVPPTGSPVTISSIDVYRLSGGKIAEEGASADLLGVLQQIGAMPGPGG